MKTLDFGTQVRPPQPGGMLCGWATQLLVLALCLVPHLVGGQTAVKYEEAFDSLSAPPGWQVIDRDGSGSAWEYRQEVIFQSGATVEPQAGLSFWFSGFTNANGRLIDEWLISPRIPGIATGDTLTFFAGAVDQQFKDTLRVFVSTTDSLIPSFTDTLGAFKVDGPVGTYTAYDFDLSPFAGSDVFVAVNYYIVDGGADGAHSDHVWVDHFIVLGAVTGIAEPTDAVHRFELRPNYPNPFNPRTTISFRLAKAARVDLEIYNGLGQRVATVLRRRSFSAGDHHVEFDASFLPSGTYYYRLRASSHEATRRMILVR